MPSCGVCGREFEQKFSFQVAVLGGVTRHYCSQMCRVKAEAAATGAVTCHVCGGAFSPEYAYQSAVVAGTTFHSCSVGCRERAAVTAQPATTRRIAVLNQKGGTGKTTTTVNLAAALADAGHKTLLVDVDVQGNVAVSLGVETPRRGLADLLSDPSLSPAECIVSARPELDLLAGGSALEGLELVLARQESPHPERLLRERMTAVDEYAYIIIDCGPARSLLNQNALYFADQVLIPVACDYLSLVGVRQILQTIRKVNDAFAHPITVLGVVPTFFDVRNRISHDVVRTLRRYFQNKVMPPVRINTRLKEAPAHKKTIFEYDGRSRGAEDYRTLARAVVTGTWDNAALDAILGDAPESLASLRQVL